MYSAILVGLAGAFTFLVLYIAYLVFIAPKFNPLRKLDGPPVHGLFGNHVRAVQE